MARTGGIVFQPNAQISLQRGIHQMVAPIRATLGPLARNVINEETFDTKRPEIIDNGGLIARRILQLPDRDADMGAMIVRHLVWRLHKSYGDGTATAAVLFQAVFDEGLKAIAAGIDPMELRRYLNLGAQIIDDALAAKVIPVSGKDQLSHLAESICHDASLAKLLGEIFDIIGEHGQLEIRRANGRELSREYVDGAYWAAGVLSREFLVSQKKKTVDLTRPAILMTDLLVDNPEQLETALTVAIENNFQSIVLIAQQVSDRVIGFLIRNVENFHAVAVTTPGGILNRASALEDLSALVGGKVFLQGAGDQLESVKVENFGRARRVWADADYLGIAGAGGDPRVFRHHVAKLRAIFAQAAEPDQRKAIQERIGRLLGGSATLRVGGYSDTESRARKELAERSADVLRAAVRGGVLPGGGAALLACQHQLNARHKDAKTVEERAAYAILIKALEAPIRTIATNSGYDPSQVIASVHHNTNGHGFDMLSGAVVDMVDAGIVDVAVAYRSAIQSAISSAAQTLTIDALVHCKNPEQVLDPG